MLWDPKKDKPVEIELDEVSKHIVCAADYIKQHGWCQSMLNTPDGKVCLMGALYASHPDIYKTGMTVHNMVKTKIGSAYVAIGGAYFRIRNHLNEEPARWNDKVAKSKEEVINLLETIAYSGGK